MSTCQTAVRSRFEAHTHLTGAPRISGPDVIWHGGELWIGSMWRARKAIDLQREPRLAIHEPR